MEEVGYDIRYSLRIWWELRNLSQTRSYRRKRALVSTLYPKRADHGYVDVGTVIRSLLLIEMHQRPGWWRAIEWALSVLWPPRLRPSITRGPLQIADGPWRLEDAVTVAASIVSSAVAEATSREEAIHAVAVVWNGAASRQPGSRFGYAQVLDIVYPMCV